jgi:dihydroorotate dehydrogenase
MTDIMLETPLDGIVACGGTIGRHGIEKSTATIHSIGRTEGALCGKPLQNRAIEVVKRIYERAKGTYPIIGCGGVTSPDEAKAMLDAGATLVQIYSEFFYGGGDSLRNIQLGLNERLRKAELNTASATEPKAEPQQTAEQVEETNNND